MKSIQRKRLASAMALVTATLATGASASALLEEVIVTAQKRAQDAQDIAISVSAFNSNQLDALGVKTAKEIAEMTSGVTLNMEYGNAPTFSIRGVGANDYGVSNSPVAAIYVDGVYKASNINSGVAFYDLEQVEILKGPQGTLWGKNTTGGAINVRIAQPTEEDGGYVQVGYGTNERRELEGAFNAKLTDNLFLRVSGQQIVADGPYKNVKFPGQGAPGSQPIDIFNDGTPPDTRINTGSGVDKTPGDLDASSIRAQIRWVASDSTDVRFMTYRAFDGGDGGFMQTIDPTYPVDPDTFDDEVSTQWQPQRDSDFDGWALNIEHDLSDENKIVSITGYDAFTRRGGGGFAWGGKRNKHQSQLIENPDAIDHASVSMGSRLIYTQDFEMFSQEVRFEHHGEDNFWMIGAYYNTEEIQDNTFGMNSGRSGTRDYGSDFRTVQWEQEGSTKSVFFHSEWDLTDELQLVAGVRWNDEKRDLNYYRIWRGNCGARLANGDCDANDPESSNAVVEASQTSDPNSPFYNPAYAGTGYVAPFTSNNPYNFPLQLMLDANNSLGVSELSASGVPLLGIADPSLMSTGWEGVSWKLGLNWRPTDSLLLYASNSLGRKSGGFDSGAFYPKSRIQPYDEEELMAWEMGFKWDISDTLRFNGATYFYDYDNVQQRVNLPDITGTSVNQTLANLKKAEVTGAEFELIWSPADGLDLMLNGSFLDTKIKDKESIVSGTETADGNELLHSPSESFTALARYEWSLNDDLVANVQTMVNYSGEQYGTLDNADYGKFDYTTVGVQVGLTNPESGWTISLIGKNITDEMYYANVAGNRAFYSEPGRWMVSVKKEF